MRRPGSLENATVRETIRGTTIRKQEKRKTEYEMDQLHKKSHTPESTEAEEGCSGHHSFAESPGVGADSREHNTHRD